MGVWMPYEWVALDHLSRTNLRPDEAVGISSRICDLARIPKVSGNEHRPPRHPNEPAKNLSSDISPTAIVYAMLRKSSNSAY